MNFLKSNFLSLIILILAGIILFSTCRKTSEIQHSKKDTIISQTIIIRDTIRQTTPILVKASRDTVRENSVEYIPSDNYEELAQQFQSLKEELLALKIYKDSVRYDSSSIVITDSVQTNKIIGRSVDFKLKYPIITKTITSYPTPKNKIFIGGELGGNKSTLINQAEFGLLFLNKRDNLLKAGIQMNFDGIVSYKVGKYWKIHL